MKCEEKIDLNEYIKPKLTHLSLFTGIGGLDLAAEWAGFTTVGQCEFADYPTKILGKHWPDVPRWRDIRTLTGESFYEQTGKRTVDIISGGFPCQPFSVAGKQRGKEDDRYLWPEMVRVIKELRPTWVIGENVAGIVNMELGNILSDLEAEGYKTRVFLVPAHAVGAPHRRYRVAIVGYTEHNELYATEVRRGSEAMGDSDNSRSGTLGSRYYRKLKEKDEGWEEQPQHRVGRSGEIVPNTNNSKTTRYGEYSGKIYSITKSERPNICGGEGWWSTEPNVGRVANGVSNRVDRIKCLGNAVVPQQFYPIFKAIADIELMV